MAQQTSIEWLYDEIIKLIKGTSKYKDDKEILHQAKSMYDKEMLWKYGEGYDEGLYDGQYK